MPFEIEFEDQGQDLLTLTVDDHTGVITDAGEFSYLYATGNCVVDLELLYASRFVNFCKTGGEPASFSFPIASLKLNGKTLADVA